MSSVFDFEEWDNQFNSETLKEDLEKVKNNNSNFDKVPYGVYEVKVEKLELTQSKTSGKPMLSCWFKIVNGEQKNRLIFLHQTIENGFGLHKANEFLKTLSNIPVSFESFKQYNELLSDIKGEIDGKYEYQLNYEGQISKKNGQTYDSFKIEKTYELTPF